MLPWVTVESPSRDVGARAKRGCLSRSRSNSGFDAWITGEGSPWPEVRMGDPSDPS